MTIEPLLPSHASPGSTPDEPVSARVDGSFASALGAAFGAANAALESAQGAERAFASGRGGLQAMVLERAQADIALSLASAAATRAAQAVSAILGMQI